VSTSAWTEITTVGELVGLLGEPDARARDKARTSLLDAYYGPSYERGLYA
jgi:hypothetical protein